MLIAWGLVTRAAGNDNYPKVYITRKEMKKKQIQAAKAGDKALAKQWKKAQLPYKKMLNALSGAMKDKTNLHMTHEITTACVSMVSLCCWI